MNVTSYWEAGKHNLGLNSAWKRAQERSKWRQLVETAMSSQGRATRWWWWWGIDEQLSNGRSGNFVPSLSTTSAATLSYHSAPNLWFCSHRSYSIFISAVYMQLNTECNSSTLPFTLLLPLLLQALAFWHCSYQTTLRRLWITDEWNSNTAQSIVLELRRMRIQERQFAEFFFNDIHHVRWNNQVLHKEN